MSDDLFRDPFVLKVIRATLVSQGMRDERLEEAVDKVVRACAERVRRSGRPPADVGQATALALTIVNAAAGRARARPDAASVPPPAPWTESDITPPAPRTESKAPPAPAHEERSNVREKAPPTGRATLYWTAAGLAATLAALAAGTVLSLRPRGGEVQPARAASENVAPVAPDHKAKAENSGAATAREAPTAGGPATEANDSGEIDGGQVAQPDASALPDGE